MKVYKCNRRDTRVAPWTALCVLSLIAAMVFALPSLVFAQTCYEFSEFSQDCEMALVGTYHTITVKVKEIDCAVAYNTSFGFFIGGDGPNSLIPPATPDLVPDQNLEIEYIFTSTGVGTDELRLVNQWFLPFYQNGEPVMVKTIWTDKEEELCADSSSPPLVIGGWDKLKDRKWGGVTIAICGVGCPDSFNVYDVDQDSVRMAGVSPRRAVYRDSRLCPDGKDGYVDLVLRFKRREVLKALETLGGELVDDQKVTLDVTGFLNDETVIAGTWEPMIKKIKKRRKWRR